MASCVKAPGASVGHPEHAPGPWHCCAQCQSGKVASTVSHAKTPTQVRFAVGIGLEVCELMPSAQPLHTKAVK